MPQNYPGLTLSTKTELKNIGKTWIETKAKSKDRKRWKDFIVVLRSPLMKWIKLACNYDKQYALFKIYIKHRNRREVSLSVNQFIVILLGWLLMCDVVLKCVYSKKLRKFATYQTNYSF